MRNFSRSSIILASLFIIGCGQPTNANEKWRSAALDIWNAYTAIGRDWRNDELRIGVRSAAAPFSYKVSGNRSYLDEVRVDERLNISTGSGPIRSKGYDGYMVRICDEVLKKMLIEQPGAPKLSATNIEVVDVDREIVKIANEAKKRQDVEVRQAEDLVEVAVKAKKRAERAVTGAKQRPQQELESAEKELEGATSALEEAQDQLDQAKNSDITAVDRFSLLGKQFDILCDPATINDDRVKGFAVSPPLFVTGIGYLSLKDEVPPKDACQEGKALIGFVGSTNAASHGIQKILNDGEWHRYRDDIVTALRAAKGSENRNCPKHFGLDGKGGIFWSGYTHDQVAKQFCERKITYYVGDLEIISEYARSYPGCDFSSGVKSFTSDQYAVFADINYESNPERALLIYRFFEVLNREITTSLSILDQAFIATFGEVPKSRKLEVFFWSMRGSP
ncbi:Bacterial extracellular solute-binding proteins, family 3 [Roseovarius albus]|uniref:Bacterial extracellular solute-binding proteins, family 3 n=1 Tax=Roseovarius albus TaxID=1247867 RepID=A0A1X6YCS8_9RHOB|nr:hypothetical protein [Roseovarius albus]SLN17192.1 Bacterial extracellular solute-binding proteins, family 3 [Roseovarius albus]